MCHTDNCTLRWLVISYLCGGVWRIVKRSWGEWNFSLLVQVIASRSLVADSSPILVELPTGCNSIIHMDGADSATVTNGHSSWCRYNENDDYLGSGRYTVSLVQNAPSIVDSTTCTCRRMRPACPLQSSPVVNDIEGCGMKMHACVVPTVRIH